MSKLLWAFTATVGLVFYSARLASAALDVDGDISDWVAADLVQMAGDPFDTSGFGYSYGQPGGNVITRWGAAVEDEMLYVFIEAEKVLSDYDFPAEIGGGRNYLWLNIDVDNSQSLDPDSMLGGLHPEELMPGTDITVQIGDDHGSPLTTHFWYQGVGDIMEHDGSDVSPPGSWTYSGRILEYRTPLDDLLAELASYPDQTPAGPCWNVAPSFEGNYGDWSMHRAPTVVICSGIPISGDFDGDGDVDGDDFLKWQRGEMPNPLSSSDLANWRANFGDVASSVAAASTTVPEPSGIVLLLAAFACGLRWRRLT